MEDRLQEETDLEAFLVKEYSVDPGQSPIRIDKYIFDASSNISRNRIQYAIKKGLVKVNGSLVKSNYKVRPNDAIILLLPKGKRVEGPPIPQDIPLAVEYEDDSVMVVNKPAGLVVHPAVGHPDGTLVNALAYYFEQKGIDLPVKEQNTEDRLGIVHRIDKDTSGLLLIAKDAESMTHLAKQFFEHTIVRKYWALVWGNVDEDKGTIEGYIGRNPKNRTEYIPVEGPDEGKWAVTHYQVVQRYYYVTLVECQLETGRTHQIRVHLKSIGHPLFNDKKYGGNRILKGTVFTKYKQFVENCFNLLPRQALHAKVLGFEHPKSGELKVFESDLPPDFEGVLDKWKTYLDYRKDIISE